MKTSTMTFSLAFLVAIGLIIFAVWKGAQPSIYTPLAQCLTEKGVKMYGAWWCSHCKEQKELFGNAFRDVTYVECSDMNKNTLPICVEAGIPGYPTWILGDGTVVRGVQSLEALAEKTSCALPTS